MTEDTMINDAETSRHNLTKKV